MSYYYRGNLAVELEQRAASSKTKRTIKIKPAIPTGEKLLYLLLIILLVIGASFVGLRYVQISQFNYEIQTTKKEIAQTQEKNAALQMQVDEMSNRDRIFTEAQSMNMVATPADSVKVIGSNQTAKNTNSSKIN